MFENYLDIQNYKSTIGRNIKAFHIENAPSVTNQKGKLYKTENLQASFNYQREGVYPKQGLDYYYKTKQIKNSSFLFTNSGQGANASILLTLKNHFSLELHKKSSVWYYETIKLLKSSVGHQSKELPTLSILFIDSSKSNNFELIETEVFDCIIVDTTCYPLTGVTLRDLFSKCSKLNKTVFLSRSHLKLDSLGTDCGNLGSISIINPTNLHGLNKDLIIKKNTDLDLLTNLVHETAGILGAGFNIDNFYPFLGDDKINEANLERVTRIQRNCDTLISLLKIENEYITIKTVPHKLFFFVHYQYKAQANKNLFLKLNSLHNLNAKYCDSFGFDFLTHGNLIKYEDGTTPTIIRITAPDYDQLDLEKSALLLNQYFKEIFKEEVYP